MWRTIMRSNRLLLTGVLLQQPESEVEKPKVKSEKAAVDQLKESANIHKILGSGRNVEEEEMSKYTQMKEELDAPVSRWDRVKMAFDISENNKRSPELYFVMHVAISGLATGYLYGGIRDYTKAVNLFIYSNEASKFLGVKEARIALAKASLEAFLKGAFFTAPKFGALCAVFAASNSAVSVYRDKNGILEFSVAGAVTTAIMKWNLGVRGMISGCVTGGFTGLILGTVISILFASTGKSMSDFKQYIYNFQKTRDIKYESNEKSKRSNIEKYYSEKTESLAVAFSDN